MVSTFKDYSSRGMCLKISNAELKEVNFARQNKQYADGSDMKDLEESPGIVVIEPKKDADGYLNFDKMSKQRQDVMKIMDTLECNVQ